MISTRNYLSQPAAHHLTFEHILRDTRSRTKQHRSSACTTSSRTYPRSQQPVCSATCTALKDIPARILHEGWLSRAGSHRAFMHSVVHRRSRGCRINQLIGSILQEIDTCKGQARNQPLELHRNAACSRPLDPVNQGDPRMCRCSESKFAVFRLRDSDRVANQQRIASSGRPPSLTHISELKSWSRQRRTWQATASIACT